MAVEKGGLAGLGASANSGKAVKSAAIDRALELTDIGITHFFIHLGDCFDITADLRHKARFSHTQGPLLVEP